MTRGYERISCMRIYTGACAGANQRADRMMDTDKYLATTDRYPYTGIAGVDPSMATPGASQAFVPLKNVFTMASW